MSERPQFNLFSRVSPAAPVTSKEQANAVPVNAKQYSTKPQQESKLSNIKETDGKNIDISTKTSQKNKESALEGSSKDFKRIDEDGDTKIADQTIDNLEVQSSDKDAAKQSPSSENISKQKETKSADIVPANGASDKELKNEVNKSNNKSTDDLLLDGIQTKSSQLNSSELNSPTHNDEEEKYNSNHSGDKESDLKSPSSIGKEASSYFEDAPFSGSNEESLTDSNLSIANVNVGEEVHIGALRRHSIEAMKELGTPESSLLSENSQEMPFDFPKFMESLRLKSADPIARYIKSFLQEFGKCNWTPDQQEKIVADFLKFISLKFKEHEPFASMSKWELRNSLEGIEKLIMNRLYTKTFPPKIPPILRSSGHNEDLLKDQIFEEKVRLWKWLEGKHLDINHEYLKSDFITLATSELGRLHQFKSPRDKMICILNCSKVIYALIRQAHLESNADSFLPLLIYVVIKSHPLHLVSTIHYIQRFRAREFYRGETAYYLSTIESAVAFVETLDKTSVTISDEEFEQRMADSVQAENARTLQRQAQEELDADSPSESSAAVLTASAGMLVDRMRKLTTKIWEDFGTEDEDNVHDRSSELQESRQRQLESQFRRQERAVERTSREEYLTEQALNEQFNETSETLQGMFPSLDKEVIEDVLRQNGSNVGSAVDLCLALVE